MFVLHADTANFLEKTAVEMWPDGRHLVSCLRLHNGEIHINLLHKQQEKHSDSTGRCPEFKQQIVLSWLKARFTNVDKALTKFKFGLDLGYYWFSRNLCCINAVQIKSQVKLGLTLNHRWCRIKLWSSSMNNYFNARLWDERVLRALVCVITVISVLITFNNNEWVTVLFDLPQISMDHAVMMGLG